MSPFGKGWPVEVVLLAAILYALWSFVALQHAGISETPRSDAHAYDRARLARHTGNKDSEDQSSTMLLVIWGRVFNVSAGGTGFYSPGQAYSMFPGHDCTKAMALTSTSRGHLDLNLDGVEEKKLLHLNDTYWHTYVRKYPIVGWYTDTPYDPVDYDQFAGPWSNVSSTITGFVEGRTIHAQAVESKCPAKRVAKAVSRAVSSLIPTALLGYGSEQGGSDL
mmetsp:Transcript_40125/g.92189  ORF Transcript_40125/g.92189 Transcript_40125/m.92189 type:complete len:221 (+) Transcript_40125:36-698(+)